MPVDGYTKLAGKTDEVGLKCCGVCSPSYSAFDWDNTCLSIDYTQPGLQIS